MESRSNTVWRRLANTSQRIARQADWTLLETDAHSLADRHVHRYTSGNFKRAGALRSPAPGGRRALADSLVLQEQVQLDRLRLMTFTQGVPDAVRVRDREGPQTLLHPVAVNQGSSLSQQQMIQEPSCSA
jgi:hypothetical protein